MGNTPDTCANGVSIGPPLYWQDRGTPNKQASLVVDPPDGRIPPLTPEAQKLAADRAAARRGRNPLDSYEDRSSWERCLTRGALGFLPTGYNNGNQIVQAPGYVIILTEMIHEARVIPLTGSPQPGPDVRTYTGDFLSIGANRALIGNAGQTDVNNRFAFLVYQAALAQAGT